jgi:nitroreductase
MGNEVSDAINSVMAVREFDSRPIPNAVIKRIAEAGRLTASASNQQPWHFVFVTEREGLRKLGSLVRTGPYNANAAAAIVVAYLKEKGDFGISDASRAVQSMMIAAWVDGVGSNWTGFAGRLDSVRAEFGIPDEYDVLAVVPLGYPKRPIAGRKKRKPFDEVVSSERFGRSMEKAR